MGDVKETVVGFMKTTETGDVSSIGGTLHDFLKEEGIYEEVKAEATKAVYAWQLEQAIKERNATKTTIADAMKTSRAQLKRVLDPKNNTVSLELLIKAAATVGKKLKIELVDG